MKKLADTTLLALFLLGLWTLSSVSCAEASGHTLAWSARCPGSSSAGCGTVSLSAPGCERNCIISAQAHPASEDWVFDHWEGAASGKANPAIVHMTVDKQVTAVFVKRAPLPKTPPPQGRREVIGYFTQWGSYGRGYLVRDVVAAGAADTLTVINYAFAGIADDLTCTSLDPFADWGRRFDASESVDGVGDTVAQPLKGNFNQLRKLKALYPEIRVLISIGGWNNSARFSAAALPENRVKFVTSCVDRFIKGRFAAGVTEAGVFDGIDIDWEYPGACGATCNWRQADGENFTALLLEFRKQLDSAGKGLLLTAAMPAAKLYHDKLNLSTIQDQLDWMNLMTYDFHGYWEPGGPTNHHANLHPNSNDPSVPPLSVDGAVGEYLAKGVKASKLAVGLPFYGRGWAAVPDGNSGGLYQNAGSLPRGTRDGATENFKVLKTKGYPEFWDAAAKANWLYNGDVFWTFDSPRAVREKMRYIDNRRLKGIMFWELSGDDGTLVKAVADCLDVASATCR